MKNKQFQELSDKLQEFESKKRQKLIFCQQHKFTREADWLRDQLQIISDIRMEVQLVADGIRKPSEVSFIEP